MAELESQVTQLEEEQAELLKEQVLFWVLHSGNGVGYVLAAPFKHATAAGPHLAPVALFHDISLYEHCLTAQW